jgi:hypothetical protein
MVVNQLIVAFVVVPIPGRITAGVRRAAPVLAHQGAFLALRMESRMKSVAVWWDVRISQGSE